MSDHNFVCFSGCIYRARNKHTELAPKEKSPGAQIALTRLNCFCMQWCFFLTFFKAMDLSLSLHTIPLNTLTI